MVLAVPGLFIEHGTMSARTSALNGLIRSRGGKIVRVPLAFLELTESPAQSVCIAGTFNNWHPELTQMTRLGQGTWVTELCLPPGNYEYRLVVDGEWIPDPLAEEYVFNPFGGINSVLTIRNRGRNGLRRKRDTGQCTPG